MGLVCAMVLAIGLMAAPIAPDGAAISNGPQGQLLAAEDRQLLWSIEHHGNILQKFGLQPLASAFSAMDKPRLESFFTDQFRAKIPSKMTPIAQKRVSNQLTARYEFNEGALKSVAVKDFVRYLSRLRRMFGDAPKTKMKIKKIFPVNTEALEGSWTATIEWRIWGLSDGGGPLELVLNFDIHAQSLTKDGVSAGRFINFLKMNRLKSARSPLVWMKDIATRSNIDVGAMHDNWTAQRKSEKAHTGGVYVADYNHDGKMDVLLFDAALPNRIALYQGTGEGRFEDVTAARGLVSPVFKKSVPGDAVVFADLDGDGWEDLLLLGASVILKNIRGVTFTAVQTNLSEIIDFSAARASVADFNKDGALDIYLSRIPNDQTLGSWVNGGKSASRVENKLLRNDGDFRFTDVTKEMGAGGGSRSVFTSVWLDANNDTWPDLYVLHEFGNGVLLENKQGVGFEEKLIAGQSNGDFGSMGVTAGDFNNDSRVDLYVSQMYSSAGSRIIGNLRKDAYEPVVMNDLRRMVEGNELYLNAGNSKFKPYGAQYDVADVGWGYGPTAIDFDNDGWLDIFATAGFISRDRKKPDG